MRLSHSLFGKREDAREAGSGEPMQLSVDGFDATVGSGGPVLVDFWAPWCGPCRMIAPAVEEIAQEYKGRAVVAKMNTDENREIVGRLGIRSIPTIVLFNNGQEVDRLVGFTPRDVLRQKLDTILSMGA